MLASLLRDKCVGVLSGANPAFVRPPGRNDCDDPTAGRTCLAFFILAGEFPVDMNDCDIWAQTSRTAVPFEASAADLKNVVNGFSCSVPPVRQSQGWGLDRFAFELGSHCIGTRAPSNLRRVPHEVCAAIPSTRLDPTPRWIEQSLARW